jgi:hypothetical protein
MKPGTTLAFFLLLLAFAPRIIPAELPGGTRLETEANVMIEIPFTAAREYSDPFNQVTLDVLFREPSDATTAAGRELRVPAFWAGANRWKVRYASPIAGTHSFRTECSATDDRGLHDVHGTVEIKPYRGTNPLYQHGPLHVSGNHRYLVQHDGTPFFWLGDTWWMGLAARLHWPDDVKRLAADRKEKGFNVIQLVAGLFPDMFPFDPRGANEAGFPWQTNYTSIRPEYFDAADQRILYLVDQGYVPCIFGAWGYFMEWMGEAKAEAHWRYLIARYGALPVVWGVAGEANLPWYLAKGFPYDDREQVTKWTEVARYLRATDPFHRLITIHPTGIGRLSARHAIDDPALLDIDMLQTPHGRANAVEPTVNTVRQSYADHPVMPVINGEAAFEMLGDNLPTEWTRRMFWLCMLNGAAGHTYGANGIWQNNRRGDPHGPSPHHKGGVGYGRIPWDEAMALPGSTQVALGKKLFQQFDWFRFEPHPEWAEFTTDDRFDLKGAHWIWYPEGNPAQNAPAEKRYFRRTFTVSDTARVADAALFASCDDRCSIALNGKPLGSVEGWDRGRLFKNLASSLLPGTNLLAIEAENKQAPAANPAGLIARLHLTFADGSTVTLDSDTHWRASKTPDPSWNQLSFDESNWKTAAPVASWGDARGARSHPSPAPEPSARRAPEFPAPFVSSTFPNPNRSGSKIWKKMLCGRPPGSTP